MPDSAAGRCQFAASSRGFVPILFVVGAWQDSLRDGTSGQYAAGAATDPHGARRRRSRIWVAAGIAAVLFVAGFFLFIAHRDSSTLKTGDRTTGQIVGEIRAAGWNPLDGGRRVVRYTIHGETRTSQIWLDNELTDYSIGENVTLFVRGRHVRTARESNAPAPWGAAALLLGVAGLGAIGRGVALRRPKRQWTPFMSEGQVVVPLAAWGFAPRKPTLYVDSTETRLSVPGYFGSHRMVVPTADVGVHVIPVESSDGDAEPEIWFEEGVRFLDLPTKWEFSYATLMLVLR